jgi:hypothetical protein
LLLNHAEAARFRPMATTTRSASVSSSACRTLSARRLRLKPPRLT